MGSKAQRFILIGSLGVGYFIYRNALREVIYQNQNTFLNSSLLAQLKSQNYTVVGQNRVLIGSPINKTHDTSRERIVILGGGIVGLSTAYYLAKLRKYDVVLIEKNDDFEPGRDGSSAGLIIPSQCTPQTTSSFLANGLKSLYSNDVPVKFSWSVLFERNISIWLTNYFMSIFGDTPIKNTQKLGYLAHLGMEEISTLEQELELKGLCDMISKGTIQLYSDKKNIEGHRKQLDALKSAGVSLRDLDQDQLMLQEPALRSGLQKYEYGYIGAGDTNVNASKLTRKIAQISEMNGTTLAPGTEFQRFLFQQETNRIVGIITSQGIILCDKIVIAGGLKSKDIVHKLGIRLPVLASQEYTITANRPEDKVLSHTLVDDQTKSYVSPLKGKYLISGGSDLGFDVNQIQDERVQYFVNATKSKIGEFDSENLEVWSKLRGLSADDVPIIGTIGRYDNVYVNTGYGNKGLTLALGSGKVLSEMIDGRVKKNVEEDYSINRFYLV